MKDINKPSNTDMRRPGASSANDDHLNPHGRCQGPTGNGATRSESGAFKGMSVGGTSPDGDEYVRKYKPRGRSDSETAESGSELNDEGTGWV